ncbi:MAG TPA: phospholipase D-like domain-containing protein [Methanobacterium sp.]|jgi:phosphatidylserine/phosphatidylglycerophosphate/cardiolipin synthase-like enzyme|nr:MAG: hypothetical protein FGO69_04400 [Methanobacterium sp.]HOI71629.1 phospholipase D-like domain-containing protein [Methanobacterium sp.]
MKNSLNRGIKGRILDEEGNPLGGLIVIAEGAGSVEREIQENPIVKFTEKYSPIPIKKDYELGKSKTDKKGYYNIKYSPSKYKNIFDDKPDIWVVVKDTLNSSELYKTDTIKAVDEVVKKVGDIIIPRNWAEGWYVTLGGSDKSRFTLDNQLEVLIDNQVELESLVQSINKAESYLYLTQFEFNKDFLATFNSNSEPKEYMADALKNAGNRGVDVKIILNENLIIPDSYQEILEFFQGSGVEVREFKAHKIFVMHSKVMIRDGEEAYVIGSPFKQEYWDTSKHLINDSRREGRPAHDVSIKIKGRSVEYTEEFFIQMWNYIAKEGYQGKSMLKLRPSSTVNGNYPVQIARSITPGTFNKKGELGIFEAYRKAIAKAEEFIYIENQFFTNSNIIMALKNALKENNELQIIVVLNQNPDIPIYKNRQEECMKKLGIRSYEDNLNHPQIGFFTLWSTGWENKQFKIQRIYVHTKLAVVDDLWATVGTANLDGSSLTHVNELPGFFNRKFHRNMEFNILLPELGKYPNSEVEKIRNSLWQEHLGSNISQIQKPSHGWLEIWQKTALENIKSLNSLKPFIKGQILPYSTESSAENQLEDLKIKTDTLEVIE